MTPKLKILVTGGAGEIGRFLSLALAQKGYNVRIVGRNLNKKPAIAHKNIEIFEGDLSQRKFNSESMKNVDICVHLAASLGGVNFLKEKQADILHNNLLITALVFEAAAKTKIKKMIYISSGLVYEKSENRLLKEEDLPLTPAPDSAYAFSKMAGEYFCKAYLSQYGLNYTILRLFNVYGPFSGPPIKFPGGGHIIPELTDRIITGEMPLKLIGRGNQIRSFTHIKDAVSAIILAIENNKSLNTDFNISSNQKISIKDLALKIWKLSGKKGKLKFNFTKSSGTAKKRIPSSSKSAKILKWKAEVKLDTGLKEVIKERLKNITY